MNEIQLIRSQLSTERQRVVEAANTCAAAYAGADAGSARDGSALEAFGRACREYLFWVLSRFDERDQRLGELYAHARRDDPERDALAKLLTPRSETAEAVGRLTPSIAAVAPAEPDTGAREGWRELARYLGEAWAPRRTAIDALLAANQRVSDWRAFSGIDADSILEERARYAQVRQTVPAGVEPGIRPG